MNAKFKNIFIGFLMGAVFVVCTGLLYVRGADDSFRESYNTAKNRIEILTSRLSETQGELENLRNTYSQIRESLEKITADRNNLADLNRENEAVIIRLRDSNKILRNIIERSEKGFTNIEGEIRGIDDVLSVIKTQKLLN